MSRRDVQIIDWMLRHMERHLVVKVTKRLPELRSYSPFRTLHKRGVFYIDPAELTDVGVVAHEFGHMIAWIEAGRPRGINFGCDGDPTEDPDKDPAERMEFDACCVELYIRRKFLKETDLTRRMLGFYDYKRKLPWVEGKGHVDQRKFMKSVFQRGADLLAPWEVGP